MRPIPASTHRSGSRDPDRTYTATVDAAAFGTVIDALAGICDRALVELSPAARMLGVGIDSARIMAIGVTRDCVISADGDITVGLPVQDIAENRPRYYAGEHCPEYQIRVEQDVAGQQVSISHSEERYETTAYRPDEMRTLPTTFDPDYDHSVDVPSPIVRGILGSMAEAGETRLQLSTADGVLGVRVRTTGATDDGYYWEFPRARVTPPTTSQVYSCPLVSEMIETLWPSGSVTLRFGRGQPLEIEHHDGMLLVLAPRTDGFRDGSKP